MKIKSVKQKSIVKQFYVYFLVASVIPFIILVYILFQRTTGAGIDVAQINPKVLLSIAVVFSILGFWGTRSFLVKIASLSNKLTETTLDLDRIDKSTILELAKGEEEGEVTQLAKVFSDIIINLEESVRELKVTKKALYQILSRIGKAVESADNFDLVIQFTLETIVEALGAKRGVIFFLDEERGILKLKAVTGINKKDVPKEIKLGDETVGWVAKERKPLLVPSLEEKEGDSLFSPPLISTPLIINDKVWGAICISGKKAGLSFSEEELGVLSNIAYQIATSFENAALNVRVEKVYFETIAALALAVEAKDRYSRGHSERVSKYALKIAEFLGLEEKDLNILRDAARLHDIGKIGITDEILHKPGKLNNEEMLLMRKHPQIGEGIVKPLKNFVHIINPIKHHHEFLDGSGYPDGLKADSIPLVTRVLTVADIFDAMITDRPYRKALSIAQAKKELEAMVQAGKVDKNVTGALFKLVEEKKLN